MPAASRRRLQSKIQNRKSKIVPSPRRPLFESLEPRSLLTAGMLDPTFGDGGLVTTDLPFPLPEGGYLSRANNANAIVVQPDGKIVAAGTSTGSFIENDWEVVRYNTDGSLDASFGVNGRATINFGSGDEFAYALAIQTDGRIVIAGQSNQGHNGQSGIGEDMAVARLNSDGSLDASFDGDGKKLIDFGSSDGSSHDRAYAIGIRPTGQIVIAGGSTVFNGDSDFAVAQLNSDGSLDNNFDGDGKKKTAEIGSTSSYDAAFDLALDNGGNIVLAGQAAFGGGDAVFTLVRLTSNGSLDSSFDFDGIHTVSFGSTTDLAYSVAVQNDGKLLVGGMTESFTIVDDGDIFFRQILNRDFAIARLSEDGSLDLSFGVGGRQTIDFGSINDWGFDIALQPGGEIVLAGISDQGATGSDFSVARLNEDGSLDLSFDSDGKQTIDLSGGYDEAHAIAIQSNGKIVIAGRTNVTLRVVTSPWLA